jgi:hypothetical protein
MISDLLPRNMEASEYKIESACVYAAMLALFKGVTTPIAFAHNTGPQSAHC